MTVHTGWELLRAFLYAAVTALVIIGLAYLLGRDAAAERDRAYFEIHDHRVASFCTSIELAEGLNRLLLAAGEELVDVPDADGIDCSDIPAPEASP